MRTGWISQAVILQDDKGGGTVLMGSAVDSDVSKVNFRVPFKWDELDIPGFLEDLKERLAKDLDIAASQMDIKERQLLGKMKKFHLMLKAAN